MDVVKYNIYKYINEDITAPNLNNGFVLDPRQNDQEMRDKDVNNIKEYMDGIMDYYRQVANLYL